MKTNLKTKKIILLLVLVLTYSCNNDAPNFKQKILFGVQYTNWAWGYQSKGFLIDSMGYVRAFDLSKTTLVWKNQDSSGYISKANMEINLSYCDSIICKLKGDSLSHYTGKIWAASKGTISKPTTQMADFGEIRYSAYIYDEKSERYKEVLIKLYGDLMINNSSKEAEDIYSWLKRIDTKQ